MFDVEMQATASCTVDPLFTCVIGEHFCFGRQPGFSSLSISSFTIAHQLDRILLLKHRTLIGPRVPDALITEL